MSVVLIGDNRFLGDDVDWGLLLAFVPSEISLCVFYVLVFFLVNTSDAGYLILLMPVKTKLHSRNSISSQQEWMEKAAHLC